MQPANSAVEGGAHLVRRHPVVGRAGVVLLLAADEGAVLDAGDVARVGPAVEAVGPLRLVEAQEGAAVDQLRGEALPLLLRPVAPHHPVGRGQGGDLPHPLEQRLVARGGVVEPRYRGRGRHVGLSVEVLRPDRRGTRCRPDECPGRISARAAPQPCDLAHPLTRRSTRAAVDPALRAAVRAGHRRHGGGQGLRADGGAQAAAAGRAAPGGVRRLAGHRHGAGLPGRGRAASARPPSSTR